MLNEICQELRNWFDRDKPKLYGTFAIQNGKITDSTFTTIIQNNQYFRIIGSVFNDGVYEYTETLQLTDEEFDGAIWLLAIPKDFLAKAKEIKDWCAANEESLKTPYQSESFGGYSYSKATGANGGAASWQTMFASDLNKWRKI